MDPMKDLPDWAADLRREIGTVPEGWLTRKQIETIRGCSPTAARYYAERRVSSGEWESNKFCVSTSKGPMEIWAYRPAHGKEEINKT